MIVHPLFNKIRDQISIREGRNTFKFCGQCGYKLRGEINYIKNHFKRFHECRDHHWLKHGEIPKSNWYTNLTAHFENPEIKLELRQDITTIKTGRPTGWRKTLSNNQRPIDDLPISQNHKR